MDNTDAQEHLQSLIEASGKGEDDLTSADLLPLALQFYETPCNGCSRDDGGDALLFQCGVYDWGQGPGLEVDFVRQFTVNGFDGEYDHTEQLHATLFYPADLAGGQDVAMSVWYGDCASLEEFRQKVTESAGYRLTEAAQPERIKIHQERV